MRKFAKIMMGAGMICTAFSGLASARSTLSLDDYLAQVRELNIGYKASSLISQGAKATSKEGKLLTRPNAFANYHYLNDKTPQVFSDAFGNQNITQTVTTGVSLKTDMGLEVKAGYRFDDIRLKGVNPAFIANDHYSTGSPAVEINQPLLRNGFGRELRAQKEVMRAQSESMVHAEYFKMDNLLSDAMRVYWDLSLARETVAARRDLLTGGRHILDWVHGQALRKLADDSDFLQAKSSIKIQELELKVAQDAVRVLSRQFNTLRGVDDSTVSENLAAGLPKVNFPNEAPVRNDVRALEEARKASQAQAKIGREQNLPSVDLAAGVALNSLTTDTGRTLGDSFSGNPTISAGVNVAVPLSFGLMGEVRRGYLAQARGNAEAIRRQSFENDRHYSDLKSRYAEANARLKLMRSIEKAEREKFSLEEEELKLGRSTTYQVFDFHEDLKRAQLARLSTQAELAAIASELQLYLTAEGDHP